MSKLSAIRHVALDMDGTIYKDTDLFDTTLPFLKLLGDLGIGYTFLTNNPSKSRLDYVKHLQKMKIEATINQIYTSTEATIGYLREHYPSAQRIFALGTSSMRDEFAANGFKLTDDSPADIPDAVIVGFDKTLTYSRLCRAAWWISRGKPWLATNPDRVCPTNEPTVLVDCGAITAALEKATGIAPAAVLGKPDPAMLQGILHKYSLEPHQLAMIGDRLYTDMELARRADAVGVLVLTGETTAAEAQKHIPQPDVIVADLHQLGKQLLRSA